MKTRHQRLQTRVSTVREELQSFLEDDDDMMKMCLTHKMEQEQNQAELVRAQGMIHRQSWAWFGSVLSLLQLCNQVTSWYKDA